MRTRHWPTTQATRLLALSRRHSPCSRASATHQAGTPECIGEWTGIRLANEGSANVQKCINVDDASRFLLERRVRLSHSSIQYAKSSNYYTSIRPFRCLWQSDGHALGSRDGKEGSDESNETTNDATEMIGFRTLQSAFPLIRSCPSVISVH